MLPYANKTLMVRFLRKRGFDVANSRNAQFSKYRNAFWLDYEDSNGCWHKAYYSAAAGRPIFSVDNKFIDITTEEVTKNHLYRLKKRTDDC